MTAKRCGAVVFVLLLGIGVWQLGSAAWIHVKAGLAQLLLQRAWARTLAGEAQAKPWPWADTWPVARLRVPAHGVDLIVLSGVSGATLAFGPGHATGTGAPGTRGAAVITGHRDTHFRFLERVGVGDEVVVGIPGQPEARFRVKETAVLDARTATILPSDGAASLVLLTCYPFDAVRPGGPLRYAVIAESVSGLFRARPPVRGEAALPQVFLLAHVLGHPAAQHEERIAQPVDVLQVPLVDRLLAREP